METWDFEDIKAIGQRAFLMYEVPKLRETFTTPDTTVTDLSEFIPDFIDQLTRPLTAEEQESGTYQPPIPPRIAMTGTYDEVQDYFMGDISRFPVGLAPYAWMTDGLPIVPPTEAKVAEMLMGTSHAPDEIVNPKLGPRQLIATVEKVAINAVMAGCKPEYMPVALAMAEMGASVGCV